MDSAPGFFLVEAVDGDVWEEEEVVYLEEVPAQDFLPYHYPDNVVATEEYEIPLEDDDIVEYPPILDREEGEGGEERQQTDGVLTEEQLPTAAYEEVR